MSAGTGAGNYRGALRYPARKREVAVMPCGMHFIFRGGAVVAQATVNRLVVGSNPTRGALLKHRIDCGVLV